MWWVIAVIVVFLWIVVGGLDTGSATQGGSPIQSCASCETLPIWWHNLSAAKKAEEAGWYAAKMAFCKSCPK